MNVTDDLLNFLNSSPVSYLAVETTAKRLEAEGFVRIDASDTMPELMPGSKVLFTKNGSSVYAFRIGRRSMADAGFNVICAHSDSPTFRIKPMPEIIAPGGVVKLNTEVYGGPILSTWLDRPLSVAGRVVLRSDDPLHPVCRNVVVERPLLQIPNIAIHMYRAINDGVAYSKQYDMMPVLGMIGSSLEADNMLLRHVAERLNEDVDDILDFDLYLYDATPACLFGLNNEFVSSGRIDDLSMVHAGLTALVEMGDAVPDITQVLAVFDNEETGSGTKQGAGSPFFASLIQRMVMANGGSVDDYFRAVENAFMVSADNAHAVHPNHPEKYDPKVCPSMGLGPVIKINASQKYASDAESSAVFASICQSAGVPCQRFVNHSDIAGGSTLGNILTSSLPMRGVDMGNPVWAMHSVREVASVADHEYCIRAFKEFYRLS